MSTVDPIRNISQPTRVVLEKKFVSRSADSSTDSDRQSPRDHYQFHDGNEEVLVEANETTEPVSGMDHLDISA